MNASAPRKTSAVLAAILAGAAAVALAACGSNGSAPPVGAPPASGHTSVQRTATLTWLAKTNLMWTKNNFAALDQVTTGGMRSVYLAEQHQAAGGKSPAGRAAFRLAGLSITVPCQQDPATFVAYADTDVFTLGQTMQPVAMVFARDGGAWKLAAAVNHPAGRWPALCRSGAGTTAPALLPSASYGAALARVLGHAATGAPETAAAATPFAVNSFFAGQGSVNEQSARQLRQDRHGQVSLRVRFAPDANPTFALPLAGGRGYWLIGFLTQLDTHTSAAGIRNGTWPDGSTVARPRPAVVHEEADTFLTTYAAIDPVRSAGQKVTLDGFFGWPLTSSAG